MRKYSLKPERGRPPITKQVRETGRREWRWHSCGDKIKLNKRGWRRRIVRFQYLFVEFTCGHWQRWDFVRNTKTGRHYCDQCELGTSLSTYDRQEAAA